MRAVPAAICLALLHYVVIAQETTNSDDYDRINTLDPKPSVRLDPYIRKALLKALSDLEENNNFTDAETTDGTTADSEFLNTSDDVSILQGNKENIQIHSFVVNGQAAFANATNTSPTIIDSNISILSTTVGNVENHETASVPTQATFREIFQTKETGTNLQHIRSIQSSSKAKLPDFTTKNYIPLKTSGISTTTSTTTTTTTTTTTPKPTHNDDGENIEEVDKKDVQVFQAPLVAAFTVHQDAQGIPKKVIPIYQQTNIQETTKVVASDVLPKLQNFNFQKGPSTEFVSHQLTLQKQLEEKQRILEEQLRLLQIQQRQQEELLKNQQLLLQQKEAQRLQQTLFEQEQFKRQQFLEQQKVLSHTPQNNFNVLKSNQQNQIISQNNGLQHQKPEVSIQPSLTLDESNTLAQHQQLPSREAVDFLIHLRNQQRNQFPLQQNHLPQGISNVLQPNQIQNFHQGLNFQLQNQIRPSDNQFRQRQSNRVFRHESGVGNFGFNNNQNYHRFNNFDPLFTNNYFSVNRINQFNSDTELKELLSHSNLNARAHEDLNIVSKVLSLNHGIPIHTISNRLPFDSRRSTRTSI